MFKRFLQFLKEYFHFYGYRTQPTVLYGCESWIMNKTTENSKHLKIFYSYVKDIFCRFVHNPRYTSLLYTTVILMLLVFYVNTFIRVPALLYSYISMLYLCLFSSLTTQLNPKVNIAIYSFETMLMILAHYFWFLFFFSNCFVSFYVRCFLLIVLMYFLTGQIYVLVPSMILLTKPRHQHMPVMIYTSTRISFTLEIFSRVLG